MSRAPIPALARTVTYAALLVASLPALGACRSAGKPREQQVTAEFGVYFGGQIQERRDIPFELDSTKQTHGFRVTFTEPPAEAHEISWHLSPPRFSKPPSGKATRESAGSAASAAPSQPADVTGSSLVQPGQRELAQVWTFKPGDPLGVWNIRVTLDRQVLIDRPFLVYDANARSQINRKSDGGR